MSEPIKLLLSLSLSATILAGIIFLLKPFVKNKISKSIQYYIWMVVLFRLILPFSFESSVMNNLFYGDTQSIEVSSQIDVQPERITPSEASSIPNVQQNVEMGKYINDVDHSRYLNDSLKQYTLYLWILGIIITLVFNIFGYLHFSRRLKISNKEASIEENDLLKELINVKYKSLKLKRNSVINTPMLIGIIKPCILIPDDNYSSEQLRNILNHEITHLKHKDIIVKWFTMVVSAVHWFNPFMYFIKKEINSACELACDETVIKNLSANEKQAYGETLISVVSEQKCPNGMLQATMCEEKKSLKERLVAIMKHKKKSKVVIILSVLLLSSVVVGSVILGAGVGRIEKEPPKLYIGSDEKERKVAITGTYGWKWSGGAIQSDSPIPYEFNFKEENIINVNPSTRIDINLKSKKDLISNSYEYEIIEARLYKNKKEIPYKPLQKVIDGKMTIVTPLVEGEYVYSLLVDFKNKGKVTYGFVLKVTEGSTKLYKSQYGWTINYPKDMDIIGENFIMKSKSDKYLSFKVIENISEEKVDDWTLKFDEEQIKSHYSETVVIKDSTVRTGPGEEYVDVAKVIYGDIIRTSGRFEDWIRFDINADITSVWIKDDCLVLENNKPFELGIITAEEIKVGEVQRNKGNLVKIIKKDAVKSCVQIPVIDIPANITGWINNKDYTLETKNVLYNQAYLKKSALLYTEPNEDSELVTHREMFFFSIGKQKGEWVRIASYGPVDGWTKKENMYIPNSETKKEDLYIPEVLSEIYRREALEVAKEYFEAFEKEEYETMKSLSTDYHNENMVHAGDVWGMKWARAKEFKSSGIDKDGRISIGVSVEMETVKTSAQYPSTKTFFFISLIKNDDGEWKVDYYFTG